MAGDKHRSPAPRLHALLPAAAGEIRERYGGAAARNRLLTQGAGRAPGSGVVDVDIGRDSLADALYQTIRHDEVHAAVAAEFARQLAGFLPELVLEARLVRVDGAP